MDGATKLSVGIGLCLLGLVITIATYSAAEGGGSYIVMYGPVVFGAMTAFRGAAQMKDERVAAAIDPVTAPAITSGVLDADDYPAGALRDGAEGRMTLGYVVDATGRPAHVELLGSSGHAELDATALTLFGERFRFEPARNARGQPVEAYHQSTVRWVLPDDEGAFGAGDHSPAQLHAAPTTTAPPPAPG